MTLSKHDIVRRYYLPTVDGLEGWAEVVITEGGFFAAVSDYGNYAFAWRSFGPCFRSFLLGAEKDTDYFTKKLQPGGDGPGDEYDGPATLQHIKRFILEHRRKGWWTAKRARDEWDALARHDVGWSESCFGEWLRETEIDDAYEMACHRRNPRALAFVTHTLARRLCPIFRAELSVDDQRRERATVKR